ncbi:hypothetical protein ACA910_019398 [Epithemia clementina (nom. ined.)]
MVVDSILFLNEKATILIGAKNYKAAAKLLHEGIARLEKEHNVDDHEEQDHQDEEHDCSGPTCNMMIEGEPQENSNIIMTDHLPEQQASSSSPQCSSRSSVVVAVEPSLEFLPQQQSQSSVQQTSFCNSICSNTNGNYADMDDDQSVFCIYRRAMKLVPTERYQNNSSLSDLAEHNVNLVSAVLLYNYGLCLHMQGYATGCEAKLEDASLAYEMALGLLGLAGADESTNFEQQQQQQSSVFLLELALLNNFGHIHMYFMSTRQVHECLRRMHYILFGATHGWAMRIPHEMSCFAHNVLFNASQHIRPAPVA